MPCFAVKSMDDLFVLGDDAGDEVGGRLLGPFPAAKIRIFSDTEKKYIGRRRYGGPRSGLIGVLWWILPQGFF